MKKPYVCGVKFPFSPPEKMFVSLRRIRCRGRRQRCPVGSADRPVAEICKTFAISLQQCASPDGGRLVRSAEFPPRAQPVRTNGKGRTAKSRLNCKNTATVKTPFPFEKRADVAQKLKRTAAPKTRGQTLQNKKRQRLSLLACRSRAVATRCRICRLA